ncbi:Diphthine synthase [Candidatus Bilamarchaeum dharawalense]|uniref:Diphthine synthase n=1 Tax=Candidatus Bilamarchaeum dharawalense TaxID=2885759 RepID=A0A5E4LKC6_9ARCH|nr:Diphthine synthase [Candidatus Bilamarchaeum dharawalense]
MTLFLVGLGVSCDITLSGLEAIQTADNVYIETYTNPLDEETIQNLEKKTGKKFEKLERDKLESSFLVNQAKSSNVCVLISGDPLTATTHVTLVVEAKQKNIPVQVIHNSSIYSTAPARSGLQIYRFGKTASLVNPRPNYKPVSSLDIIRENLTRNLHTLVLLDTEPQPMEAKVALEMLSEFETAVVLSCVGHKDEKIVFGKVKNLIGIELGKPPFTLIIPAKLHHIEEEYLNLF